MFGNTNFIFPRFKHLLSVPSGFQLPLVLTMLTAVAIAAVALFLATQLQTRIITVDG